jgi:hypothetical protein
MPAALISLSLSLLACDGAPPAALSSEAFVDAVRRTAAAGVDADRARAAYNLLARRVFARYPQLLPPARLAGIPEQLSSREDFACAVIQALLAVDLPALTGLPPNHAEELRALAATWLQRGLRLDELVEWDATRRGGWPAPRPAPRGDLDELLLRCRASAAPGGTPRNLPEAQPARLQVTPELVRAAVAFLEDFLSSYGEGEREQASEPPGRAPAALLRLLIAPGRPRAEGKVPFQEASADPAVSRGLERLFRDLGRELFGIDAAETRGLVERLPEKEGWVIAFGGYLEEGAPGVAFHRLAADYIQISLGSRMRVVWLRAREDLEELLLDPAVKRLVLAGHASMGSYSFQGFRGPPEEVAARLLSWAAANAAELALEASAALAAGDGRSLRAYLARELGLGWETWRYEDFERIAALPRFEKKERIILYACSTGEVIVHPQEDGFEAALVAELREQPGIASLLHFRRERGGYSIDPLSPSAAPAFREALPQLLAGVRRRLGSPFRVEAGRNFLELLANQSSRFPGVSWGHDFLSQPEGFTWSTERLVAEVREALGDH